MSTLIIFILLYLYAIPIVAHPIDTPASTWDIQRSTNFKLIHDAAILKYAEEKLKYDEDTKHTAESVVIDVKLNSTAPAERVARKKGKVTQKDSTPMPGMQCTVM